jgi:PAS domain S-box-containing protein
MSSKSASAPFAKPAPGVLSEAFTEPQQLVTAFFGASSVGFAVCDDQLRFQAINQTLADMNGLPAEAHLGKTVREILGDAADHIEPEFKRVLQSGEPTLNFELCAQLPTRADLGYWIENYFPIKDSAGRVKQIGSIVVEVTQQKRLEQSLHNLTGKLLHTQDEEHRRIARDLHDSISQYHAAIKMNLTSLARVGYPSSQRNAVLTQSLELLEDCISETRTLSYLLHPPMLDEMGFFSAVTWYAKGFAQRSGIKVNLTSPPEPGRLPTPVEIALFRVVQEALTNIHRHAHTSVIDIRIQCLNHTVQLAARDYGCGIRPEKLRQLREQVGSAGLGIAGMYERVRELGGKLDIQSNHHGTSLNVEVPLHYESSPALLARVTA